MSDEMKGNSEPGRQDGKHAQMTSKLSHSWAQHQGQRRDVDMPLMMRPD
jgi:hypothetical protein